MNVGSTVHFQPGSWQETVFDIAIGLLTGAGHFLYFFLTSPIYFLTGQQIFNDKPQSLQKGEGELKVVGIGFGRTGTVSFKISYHGCDG